MESLKYFSSVSLSGYFVKALAAHDHDGNGLQLEKIAQLFCWGEYSGLVNIIFTVFQNDKLSSTSQFLGLASSRSLTRSILVYVYTDISKS